ncbi:MAG: Gfo/Idh/MocA family oxidoreductase, partial [Acidobacteriota bacterium]
MNNQSPKTKNQKPKTAVIGVGSLGQHHARNFAELSNEGKGEFIGVCDSNEENARTIAEKNNCEYFTDWRELLDKVDAVSIVTPTETHSEIACEFLEKGVNVLVEKPFAKTLEEADKMIAAAQKTDAKLMVGHLERYNPAMVALRPHVTKPL